MLIKSDGFNFKSPSKGQWRQIFKVLSKREKIVFLFFAFSFSASFLFLASGFYRTSTKIVPAEGGKYIEGILGQPRFLNPVYAQASDADRDLAEILFSGLMKYDSEGKTIPDLAEKYQILEEGKIYEFFLKKDLFWSDGLPLTVDDIIFTIKTVQNPDYKSPLRANWLEVSAEKISEGRGIMLKLKNPSSVFLENATLKILPEHIWKDISAQSFPLSAYNLKPVSSGPYKFKKLSQDRSGKIISIDLTRNSYYFGRKPKIDQISFKFFGSSGEIIESFKKNEINGFSLTNFEISEYGFDFGDSATLHSLSLPRYFAVFLNPEKSKILSEKKIRLALNYATDKNYIVEQIFRGLAKTVESPVMPGVYGLKSPTTVYEFNPDKANALLEEAGFAKNEQGIREKIVKKNPVFQFKTDLKSGSSGTEVKELQKCLARDPEIYPDGQITGRFGTLTKNAVIKFQEKHGEEILKPFNLAKGNGEVLSGTRKKLNEVCFEKTEEKISLKISLATVNLPEMAKAAELLKDQWKNIGVELEIKTFEIGALEREIIKKRDYEALFFGEVLGIVPDPFPFWHSSQKKDPGLNLAYYDNKEADNLLKESRVAPDENSMNEKLEKFQNILIADAPAVFLYNPDYLFFTSKNVGGILAKIISDPSKRFSEIENWHIKIKRAWK